jgi:hypothetical protein
MEEISDFISQNYAQVRHDKYRKELLNDALKRRQRKKKYSLLI